MNRWEREARATGYMAGLSGEEPNRAFWPPDCRFQYDAGLSDGQIMRAVRSGDLSRINPAIPRHLTAPRLMLTDDISATGDDCREFLREAEMRKMKESAFYYLQYYLAMNAPLKIPKYIVDSFKLVEDELKDITGIRGCEPSARQGNWRRSVSAAAVRLGATHTEIPGLWAVPGHGELTDNQLLGLAARSSPKCGQCEGSGVIRGGLGGDGQDEPCPVCDGSGRLP